MLIILSQRIDTDSDYSDEVFETYHYPSRYKNQIHEGDTFVYYQGNRYVKEQRYYFGVGTIGQITSFDEENYYASLINVRKFNNTVPIYLPDGKYVEQLGYETVRKSPTPPWQSSVRPLSQQAYDYIISAAGIQQEAESQTSVEALKEQLKTHIRAFYLDNDNNSVIEIRDTANKIIRAMNIAEKAADATNETYTPVVEASEKLQQFFEYCETTRLTYSYKPVLILAFLKCADKNGIMKLEKGVKWVRQYYEDRKLQGKKPEIKKCIYLNDSVTDEEIRNNLISNPIKALSESGYFFFNNEDKSLILSQEIWPLLGRSEKLRINKICLMRLQKYFNDN